MKRLSFFLLIMMALVSMNAQKVTVRVSSPLLKDKTVKVLETEDRISLKQKEIGRKDLHSDTSCTFTFNLDEKKEITVKADLMSYHFLACPNHDYILDVQPFNDSVFSFAFRPELPAELLQVKDDTVNQAIDSIDEEINAYLDNNRRLLYVKDSLTIARLDSLFNNLSERFSSNSYLRDYLTYSKASLSYGLRLESRKNIKETLFAGKPVLYDNLGYIDCLATVFGHYFAGSNRFISTSETEYYLNTNDYKSLSAQIAKDKTLDNDTLREVVILLALKDAYTDGCLDRPSILRMLKKIIETTQIAKHKLIAENLVSELKERGFSGQKAVNFTLKDAENRDVEMQSLYTKPTLLCFVNLSDVTSLKELEAVNFCYDSIKDSVNVVAICCDRTLEKMYNFLKNSKVGSRYKWTFLYFDRNWDMIESYHVRFFPTFMLVSEEGFIEQNPMRSPSAGSLLKFMGKE